MISYQVTITELLAMHGHLVVRTEAGWRIERRTIFPRRAPLGR
jgi:hypothetical protein